MQLLAIPGVGVVMGGVTGELLPLDLGPLHPIQRCYGRMHPWVLCRMSGWCRTLLAGVSGCCNFFCQSLMSSALSKSRLSPGMPGKIFSSRVKSPTASMG